MRRTQTLLFSIICLLSTVAFADHHHHVRGPHGGLLVAVGEVGHHVELLVQNGDLVTAMVLGKDKKPVALDAANIILTFTEKDGEKEDYKVPAKKGAGFQRKSAHLVSHIVRDKMMIKVKAGGKEHASKTFAYPHGPNGGELIRLGKSDFHAELVVTEDTVSVHVLNNRKKPTKVDAAKLTLTFTEPDGELEDYEIAVKAGDSRGTVFERKSKHVVKHVKRDKIAVKLAAGGKTHTSKTFKYPAK